MDPVERPTTINIERYALAERLEVTASKLENRLRGHFTDASSLCISCRWSTVTRQASKNARRIHCSQLNQVVPEDISECNAYRAVNELTLGQMAEIALLVNNRPEQDGGYF